MTEAAKMTPMDAETAMRIGRRAYHDIIEDIARAQSLLVQVTSLRVVCGDKALVPVKMLRGHPGMLKNAVENMHRFEQGVREGLEVNYKLAALLEERLLVHEREEAEDFGRAMAERFREDSRASATRKKANRA